MKQVLDAVLSAMELEDQGDSAAALDAFSSARARLAYAMALVAPDSSMVSAQLVEEVCKGLLATYDSKVEVSSLANVMSQL